MLPKISLEKALFLATGRIRLGKDSRHEDYVRTVELARDYRAFITGRNMEHMYRRYDPRESKVSFEQSLRLTNPLTPSVCAALTNPLLKLANVIPKTNTILYENDADRKRETELRSILDSIYGDNDLVSLIGKQFLEYGVMDPNAFVLWTFENFDNRYEKPQVFHTIIPAEDVYGFEYKSDVLQWLWIHKPIKYEAVARVNGQAMTWMDGDRYVFYTADHHIVFEQVRADYLIPSNDWELVDGDRVPVVITENEGVAFTAEYWMKAGPALYRVTFYNQKAGRVPATRLGYKYDALTYGRTCVNLWHPAYEHLMSLVKLGREKDLSFVLHTFLQKLTYVAPCRAEDCRGGYLLTDGKMCGSCKGTGKQVATTASDHIELNLPPLAQASMMMDLEKLVHYVTIPTDILEIQIKNIQDTIQGAFKSVYNSDVFLSDTTSDTAKGKELDLDSVNDTLQAPSRWFAATYMDSGYIAAEYNSIGKGLTIIFRFPRDFKFQTARDIIYTMKEAKAAGASTAYLSSLNDDLTVQQFQDDPFQLSRVQTMTRFDPFPGKTDDVIMSIISQKLTTQENAVLWGNMAQVFDMAEASNTGPVTFYDLAYSKQREIVNKIVAELIEAIDSSRTTTLPPVGDLGTTDEEVEVTRTSEEEDVTLEDQQQ